MNDCGQKITELRKKNNLTQLELGNKLNVTAQAISKWENGLAEPDIETLKKICNVFNVSINELIGGEVVATAEESAPAKQIVGYCEKCHKPLDMGDYKVMTETQRVRHGHTHHTVSSQHVYCEDCYKTILAEKQQKEEKERQERLLLERAKKKRRFKLGLTFGIISFIVVAIVFLVVGLTRTNGVGTAFIVFAILGTYGFGAFISQCFWDGYVLDILEFFLHSFRMPGVIFTLDLNGIISLIFIKLTLSILSSVLSLLIFLLGVGISCCCSIFTFPFAVAKNSKY